MSAETASDLASTTLSGGLAASRADVAAVDVDDNADVELDTPLLENAYDRAASSPSSSEDDEATDIDESASTSGGSGGEEVAGAGAGIVDEEETEEMV